MSKCEHTEKTLRDGLTILRPILRSDPDPMTVMNTVNKSQEHYREALESRVCPVCEDSACETKSDQCGK